MKTTKKGLENIINAVIGVYLERNPETSDFEVYLSVQNLKK